MCRGSSISLGSRCFGRIAALLPGGIARFRRNRLLYTTVGDFKYPLPKSIVKPVFLSMWCRFL